MSADASSPLAQSWAHGVGPLERTRPMAPNGLRKDWSAAMTRRVLRWAGRSARRWLADGQPQDADELLACARSIELDMPGLAADLRAAALRHDGARD